MRINGGIALIAIGAIIAFAIRDTSSRIDLTAVGIIIMLGGVFGLWFSYRLANAKHDEEVELIKPSVEEQYTTEPHEYAVQEQIDVTPSHLPKDP
jgi:multisubunit Na+/H+ antiporter MnhG subunit